MYNISKSLLIKKYGYDTLIVWDYELKDLDKLRIKIERFSN